MNADPTLPAAPPRLGAPRPIRMLLIALLLLTGAMAWRLMATSLAKPEVVAPTLPIAQTSEEFLVQIQDKVREQPDNSFYYAQLGVAFLQRVRESADPNLYLQAQQAFEEALARNPEELDALVGQGVLANARHEFESALTWADRALAVNPVHPETFGVKADALVELGRYDEAVATLQQMVDLRPDLASYSRVSYLRELHGDMPGAIEWMERANRASVRGSEGWLWTKVQLGHLYFNQGQLDKAEAIYREALQVDAEYTFAQAALARIQAERGEDADAIRRYQELTQRLPLPEFVIALGELYEASGQPEQAKSQYDLLRVMQQLNADAGMNVDMELALFNANHGEPAQALSQARAAYAARPSIYAADVLAWALYQNGEYEEAQQYSQDALRLGTQDAALHYRAGKIAHALGDDAAARQHLEQALAINPHFSRLYASDTRALLDSLGQ